MAGQSRAGQGRAGTWQGRVGQGRAGQGRDRTIVCGSSKLIDSGKILVPAYSQSLLMTWYIERLVTCM